ncbi:MAG: glycerol-3-phosphate acyltransferase [Chloroflexi bacterium]|nr:glycerol-3-phosphate acyltransferase [Chloroflexota bacterium]MCI0576739.1 glycerol-3-phosphate acyltransferase [Chloroflexota bacterium]MCI0645999.1 glycerol-3-phosphate acyltransferase [Chloroflexota bacterium]MCI0726852.1 glycerol-3-phosphate acyltransferase [Chloroflexota bacterium]
MVNAIYLFLSAFIGYVLGAVPAGFLLVKVTKKVDLRTVGSGRTGGTNSFRAAGLPVGILTAVTDVLKAACAVWAIRALLGERLPTSWLPWAEVITGIFSVIGHNWSVFLGWRGGAGTGPNVGWAAAIWWPIVPAAIVIVLAILLLVGIASLASLSMAVIIPISFAVLYLAGVGGYDHTLAYLVGGLISAAVVTWALRPNIKRLLEGKERLVGPRARAKGSNSVIK